MLCMYWAEGQRGVNEEKLELASEYYRHIESERKLYNIEHGGANNG